MDLAKQGDYFFFTETLTCHKALASKAINSVLNVGSSLAYGLVTGAHRIGSRCMTTIYERTAFDHAMIPGLNWRR